MFRLNKKEVGKKIWLPLTNENNDAEWYQFIFLCSGDDCHKIYYLKIISEGELNAKMFTANYEYDRTVSFSLTCPPKTLRNTKRHLQRLMPMSHFWCHENGNNESHYYAENYRILRRATQVNNAPVQIGAITKCVLSGKYIREYSPNTRKILGGWALVSEFTRGNTVASAISGELMPISQAISVDGGLKYVHESEVESCMTCDNCGGLSSSTAYVDGEELCHSCLIETTVSCDRCGDRHLVANMEQQSDGEFLCDNCIESEMVCDVCGSHYHDGGDNYGDFNSCQNCYDEHIKSYYTKFNDLDDFHNRLMFGVEMEFECNENRVLAAKMVKEKFGELIMVKYDGSLDYGIEVVTRPMPLSNIIQTTKAIADFMSHYSKEMPDGTGIHVHVNKRHLSAEDISKMIYIFSELCSDVEAIAQRDTDEWAEICPVSKNEAKDTNYVLGKNRDTRRRAINTTNEKTIEFRIFQGGVPSEDVEAYILFLHLLIKSAKSCDVLSMESMSFQSLFQPYMNYKRYQPLFDYLIAVGVLKKEDIKVKKYNYVKV